MRSMYSTSFFRGAAAAIAAAAVTLAPAMAKAGEYPDKPVRLIVPFPPGGTTDILARIVAEGLTKQLGQPFIVENRAGASGIIGSEYVARLKDEGYTIGMATVTTHAINPYVHKLTFDIKKDLKPIGNLAIVPNVITVNPSLGVKTLAELTKLLKGAPEKYAYASSGTGAEGHVAMVAYNKLTGTQALHVPYKGSGPAIADTIAGHTQIMEGNLPSLLPHIQSGKLVALAVTTSQRLPVLPDVPTFAEAGLPQLSRSSWFGLVASASTPAEVVAKLNTAVNAVLALPETREAVEKLGGIVAPDTPAEFGKLMDDEMQVQEGVVKWANITP